MVSVHAPESHFQSPIARFGVRLLAVMMLIVAPIMFYKAVEDLRAARASRSWPTTQGAVSTSQVRQTPGTIGKYEANIEYRFDANGRGHIGHELRFADMRSTKQQDAEALVQNYPVGKPVTVYFNPADPESCTLEPGVTSRNYIQFIFPVAALVMGFLGWRVSRRAAGGASGVGARCSVTGR